MRRRRRGTREGKAKARIYMYSVKDVGAREDQTERERRKKEQSINRGCDHRAREREIKRGV